MAAAEFDYVVVGAGSAGACLAARLGEDASKTTCVIEAGGPDSHPFIHIPSFVAAAIGRAETNWRFATVPQPGMAGRSIPVPRGSCSWKRGRASCRHSPSGFPLTRIARLNAWAWKSKRTRS